MCIRDRSSSIVVEKLTYSPLMKMDILLDIDNSRSMADKQQILSLALDDLISGLAAPPCLDVNGNLVAQPDLRTSVECLVARGPGTLSGKPANVQLVAGQAVNERGVWHVQLQRSMSLPHEHGEADERAFKSGDYLPVSFAVWNGSAGDRDGKKNISIWQKLVIE